MDDRTREQCGVVNAVHREPDKVATIGGGPGGMFTAWRLGAKAGPSRRITVFEASDRLGGKIQTGQFAGVGPYEAGAAEIYDYSRLGPDPLHDLIVKDLGSSTRCSIRSASAKPRRNPRPRARFGQWYEDPESLLYCVYERAWPPGPSSLDEAPAEENPPEDQKEYDDVALVGAW